MPSLSALLLKNPNLDQMNSDYLYHLGIQVSDTNNPANIIKTFGDVKFICMGGTKSRMEALARHLRTLLEAEDTEPLIDLCEKAERYVMYKIGTVLVCSHGLGMSSFSVLLHELLKLVWYARCQDPVFIRLGTSGGLGVTPGTVVVSRDAYNGLLRNEHEIAILGRRIARPAKFHTGVMQDILKCGNAMKDNFETISGNTMAAECFYEGQGRLDGAVCHYSKEEKLRFLKRCYDIGIRNIEMEATMFSSLLHHLDIKAADVCVTLLDRLNGDQIELSTELKADFEKRPLLIVGRYIQNACAIHNEQNNLSGLVDQL